MRLASIWMRVFVRLNNVCLTCHSGGDQHWQHQDCRQCCAVRDSSHRVRHQVRERPQGERPVAPFALFNNVNMWWTLCLGNKSSPRLCHRFWLWTSWEGFSWTTTGTFGWCRFLSRVTFYLSPVFPAFSLWVILTFPSHKAGVKLTAGGERSLPAGCYQPGLTNRFPWRH